MCKKIGIIHKEYLLFVLSHTSEVSDKFYEEISVGLKFQYNVMVSCKSKASLPCFDQLTIQNAVLSLK